MGKPIRYSTKSNGRMVGLRRHARWFGEEPEFWPFARTDRRSRRPVSGLWLKRLLPA